MCLKGLLNLYTILRGGTSETRQDEDDWIVEDGKIKIYRNVQKGLGLVI